MARGEARLGELGPGLLRRGGRHRRLGALGGDLGCGRVQAVLQGDELGPRPHRCLLGGLPPALGPAHGGLVAGLDRGLLVGRDERGDAVLPSVVVPQPLDADLVDDIGHRAIGDPPAELGIGVDRSAQLAQRAVGMRWGWRTNGLSAAGNVSGALVRWARATANSTAERR